MTLITSALLMAALAVDGNVPVGNDKTIGPSVSVGGKALRVEPMRCSAIPVNIRWPGHQREKDQTEICFFARFDLIAPVEVVVTAPRAFTNAVVRPVSKKVAVTREGDRIRFTLAKPGAYSVEFDGRHENLMVFADKPKDIIRMSSGGPTSVSAADATERVPPIRRTSAISARASMTSGSSR